MNLLGKRASFILDNYPCCPLSSGDGISDASSLKISGKEAPDKSITSSVRINELLDSLNFEKSNIAHVVRNDGWFRTLKTICEDKQLVNGCYLGDDHVTPFLRVHFG